MEGACAAREEASTLPLFEMTDAKARRALAKEDVKGLALAVIYDGKIIHVAACAERNVELELSVEAA